MKNVIVALVAVVPFMALAANGGGEVELKKQSKSFELEFTLKDGDVVADYNSVSFYPLFPGETATVESNGVTENLRFSPVNNSETKNGKLKSLLQAYVTSSGRFHVSYQTERCGKLEFQTSWTDRAFEISKSTPNGCTLSVTAKTI
ncbi:hypothetical protein [Pseudoalteromonas lipolytica]|uniref:hypothetical protein n=1 Tax=Pseudoalteromonas lipolytica TaxID=570156 RepID=UPI0030A40269